MLKLNAKINLKQSLEQLIGSKDLVLNISAVIIALLIARAVNTNLGKKISYLQSQIEEQKTVNASGAVLHKLQTEFNNYKQSVPEDINPFNAVEKINKVASETKIWLISVMPAEAKDKTVYLEYPINIKLETNYFEMANFLKKLEDLRIFRIVSLEISTLRGLEEFNENEVQKLVVNVALQAISLKNEIR